MCGGEKKCAMVESGIGKDVYLAPKCTKKFKYMRTFPQTPFSFNSLPLRDILILASYWFWFINFFVYIM